MTEDNEKEASADVDVTGAAEASTEVVATSTECADSSVGTSVENESAVKREPVEMPPIGSALKGMLSFYTMIPLKLEQKNIDDMNGNFFLAPFIGLLYGLLGLFVFFVFIQFATIAVAAVATVAAIHMFNRFLHIDGLIDVGDGLTVAGSTEDHVRALKDTNIGAGGMVAGALMLILTIFLFMQNYWFFAFFVVMAEVLARLGQVSAATFGIAGTGMAGDSVRKTTINTLAIAVVLTLIILCAYFGIADLLIHNDAGHYGLKYYIPTAVWVIMILDVFVAVAMGFLMATVANRNFGSTNGDVLGATNEFTRIAVLLFTLIFLWIGKVNLGAMMWL